MAIYSFNHDSFGKTTNRAGAAGDNAAYNAREHATRLDKTAAEFSDAARNAAYNARAEATYAVRSHVIPPEAKEAEAWFREQSWPGGVFTHWKDAAFARRTPKADVQSC